MPEALACRWAAGLFPAVTSQGAVWKRHAFAKLTRRARLRLCHRSAGIDANGTAGKAGKQRLAIRRSRRFERKARLGRRAQLQLQADHRIDVEAGDGDRKSTRLNSSH